MTFFEILQEIGLKVEYGFIPDDEPAVPPFLVYYFDEPDIFHADNINYHKDQNYILEYYFTQKDLEIESKIEQVLTAHEIPFSQSGDVWIESEKLFVNYFYC